MHAAYCPHPLKLLADASGNCMYCQEIERAVAQERERCAKVVESIKPNSIREDAQTSLNYAAEQIRTSWKAVV